MFRSICVLAVFVMAGCTSSVKKNPEFSSEQISGVISKMTDLMVHDVTNPPLAARFFAYASLAGYEVVSQNSKDCPRMHGLLNEYPDIKKPDSIKGYSYQLSAVLAMLETASRMQPSGSLLKDYRQKLLDSCAAIGFDEETIENSSRYAAVISKQILDYAKADRYNRISNFPRYSAIEKEGYWYPTPPAYLPAVEPNFNSIRPLTLDSAAQFKPVPPVEFSRDKNSPFFRLMMQNYRDTLDDAKKAIAAFWDCNPFAVQDKGHLMMSLKKISPGAHWLGITGIACKQANKNFDESMKIHATVSIGLLDAFIACWDEKFRSNRIRPETAIRKYIDPSWQPLLQTPPFPEYLSGHSTVSASSQIILTHFFGDQFAYTDSVEVSYGLPPRSFKSFKDAAAEAAISRFYGGIHFMDAIDNGTVQGTKTAEWLLARLNKNGRF